MYKIRGTIFTQTFQFDLASLDRNQYIKVAVLYINFYLVGIESSNLHSMEHNICNILGTFCMVKYVHTNGVHHISAVTRTYKVIII